MIRAGELAHPEGDTDATITLPHADRYRRRGVLTTDQGDSFLLDLPDARELANGHDLVLEDARRIRIVAADEPLIEVQGRDTHHLMRLIWHLGNRHLPVDIAADRVRIQSDHVIEAMLAQLGATLSPVVAPFRPETGAYGHGRTHGHSHSHDPHADPDAHLRDDA